MGLISNDQLQVALTEQKQTKKLFGAILVEMGFITESVLGEILAESSGTTKFASSERLYGAKDTAPGTSETKSNAS